MADMYVHLCGQSIRQFRDEHGRYPEGGSASGTKGVPPCKQLPEYGHIVVLNRAIWVVRGVTMRHLFRLILCLGLLAAPLYEKVKVKIISNADDSKLCSDIRSAIEARFNGTERYAVVSDPQARGDLIVLVNCLRLSLNRLRKKHAEPAISWSV